MSRSVFPVDVELYWYDVLLAHNRFWHGKPAYEGLGIQIKETRGKGVGGQKALIKMHMEGNIFTLVKDKCTCSFCTATSR